MFKTLLIWNSQHDHRDVVKNVQEGDHRVPEEETQIIGVATAQQDSTLEVFALIVFFLTSNFDLPVLEPLELQQKLNLIWKSG